MNPAGSYRGALQRESRRQADNEHRTAILPQLSEWPHREPDWVKDPWVNDPITLSHSAGAHRFIILIRRSTPNWMKRSSIVFSWSRSGEPVSPQRLL